MKTIAAILYIASTIFVWFFIGMLLFKVDPKLALIIITLLLLKQGTGTYLTVLQIHKENNNVNVK